MERGRKEETGGKWKKRGEKRGKEEQYERELDVREEDVGKGGEGEEVEEIRRKVEAKERRMNGREK